MASIKKAKFTSLKHLELDTLLDITNAINTEQDEQSLLKIFLFAVVANFKISHLAIYSRELSGWNMVLKHGLDKDFSIPADILGELGRKYAIVNDKNEFPAPLNEIFEIVIPVGRKNRNVAMAIMGGASSISKNEREESLKFIQTIANIITVAIQNIRLNTRRLDQQAIKREIELAQKLQSQLFPSVLPNNPELQIFASYLPQLMVGGDYYDYIKLNADEFVICIADVSGKGVPAAFLVSNLQSALRILVKQAISLEKIVTELNELVFHNAKGEKFITFFIARYNLKTNVMNYINCGHNEPILFRRNGEKHYLNEGTLILGAFEDLPDIKLGTIFEIKDTFLFAYTDGLTETFDMNNTDIGLALVEALILESTDNTKLHHNIISALRISNIPIDDITMLSCKVGK
ncbi:MAG: GAF domain-containing SpoIIE family protein phosphatase [Cytophagales bacterium]